MPKVTIELTALELAIITNILGAQTSNVQYEALERVVSAGSLRTCQQMDIIQQAFNTMSSYCEDNDIDRRKLVITKPVNLLPE